MGSTAVRVYSQLVKQTFLVENYAACGVQGSLLTFTMEIGVQISRSCVINNTPAEAMALSGPPLFSIVLTTHTTGCPSGISAASQHANKKDASAACYVARGLCNAWMPPTFVDVNL